MGLIRKGEKEKALEGAEKLAVGGGGWIFSAPTEQSSVCVRHRPGPVNQSVDMCVFLWKSHPGSTNTVEGSTPAMKNNGSFNNLHCSHTQTHTLKHVRFIFKSASWLLNPNSSSFVRWFGFEAEGHCSTLDCLFQMGCTTLI